MATQIRVENISDAALNGTNCVYCSEEDFNHWIKLGSLIRLLGENPFYAYKFGTMIAMRVKLFKKKLTFFEKWQTET